MHLIPIKSSIIFDFLWSHTAPVILKNLSIDELDAGIFSNIMASSNKIGNFD